MTRFPEGFVWGVAGAAYQCEGAWDADGKGRSIWDDFSHTPGRVLNGDTGDTACDSYHRFAEDIKLLRRFGVKAYRFSVNWPRILPEGTGRVNEAGLAYYERLVDSLLRADIEPWATLYHWELPSALMENGKNGWLGRGAAEALAELADVFARRMKGKIRRYMTVNEPQCVAGLGYGKGEHAPGLTLPRECQLTALYNTILAHSLAAKAVRAIDPGVLVGTVTCGDLHFPAKPTKKSIAAARRLDNVVPDDPWGWMFNHVVYLDPILKGTWGEDAPAFLKAFEASLPAGEMASLEKPDFLGINVYHGIPVEEDGTRAGWVPGSPKTAMKWPVTPEVLRYGIGHVCERYGLPVYITENGQSCNDRVFLDGAVHDADRIDYMQRYLIELHKCIGDGGDVRGYFAWSLLDNFEWAYGYDERFGLVYVDYETFRRIPKDSFHFYSKVIEENGANL
ncbi:MAG TPA: GH1 family beta-glucosidase [Clostridia bacterium]|nr:GH1 family beta-glucosidase [Clostridia bacterium]